MDLKLATYFTAFDIRTILNEERLLDKFKNIFKELGINKVYLENYRDGYVIPAETMERVKKLFE